MTSKNSFSPLASIMGQGMYHETTTKNETSFNNTTLEHLTTTFTVIEVRDVVFTMYRRAFQVKPAVTTITADPN